MEGKLRLGVDVGGTFTKAIAVQTNPYRVITQTVVPTTHMAAEGVALGVIQALQVLLAHPEVPLEHVSLVAHSTTQAVNALLEGDTAVVGIVGMGRGRDVTEGARRTRVGDIPLAPGKTLHTHHVFIDTTEGLTPATAAAAVEELVAHGAQVIVASEAFSVDDPTHEQLVIEVATERGLPAVAGHQLSGIYGLEIRTLTATINASLLPKMLQTAELVEHSLRRAGIRTPLMVMRGDGGLTDLATLRHRPILTLFSGPAASLVGALLSGGIAEGVFIEVGGTSSNLGIVRGGQPVMRYVWVMEHPTCVRSLDVWVQGVAGGSMIRVRRRKIADIGPRSAHIAGLPYASFSPELLNIPALTVDLMAPVKGDPAEYVVVRTCDGRCWALTLTCAANALGYVPTGTYALGSQEAALRGFAALGRFLNCSAEEAARRALRLATQRMASAVQRLTKEYKLHPHAFQLIGGGGGAGALVPTIATYLGVPYQLVEYAEVIASLGDAMASVREVVERTISATTSVEALTREAEQAAMRTGATPESVQVVIERDEERQILRAVATGHVALAAPLPQGKLSEAEARVLTAQSAHVLPETLTLLADTGIFWVYQSPRRFWRSAQTLVVDRQGLVRLQVGNAQVVIGTSQLILDVLSKELNSRSSLLHSLPVIRVIVGTRLLDLATEAGEDGVLSTVKTVLDRVGPEESIVAIIEK